MSQNSNTAILLVNLGSPDSPSSGDIRKFLREFLSDPRVVNLPRALWLPILWCFVLPFRPSRLVEKYQSIWGDKDAPIREITERQVMGLRRELQERSPARVPRVACAMTYGSPSIASALEELASDGVDQVLVLPLFPQYSGSTTGAAYDVVAKALMAQQNVPSIRLVRDYHDHPGYITALCDSLDEWHKQEDRNHLVFSFHGTPVTMKEAGDPYQEQCHNTARLVAEHLGLDEGTWRATFQSRFGPAEWLTPYTDETLASLPAEGVDGVTLICPGFSADCLETLEEINMENRALFIASGGRDYTYIPALNDNRSHIRFLADLALSHLGDWVN